MPNWCISIALLHGNIPVVGVITAPCHDKLYAAALDTGATLNGKRLALDPERNIRNAVTGIGAKSHVPPALVAKMVEARLEADGNLIRSGPGALMLAHVAAGRLVGYYEPYMHACDCLAGYRFVKDAGGWFHLFPLLRRRGQSKTCARLPAFKPIVRNENRFEARCRASRPLVVAANTTYIETRKRWRSVPAERRYV